MLTPLLELIHQGVGSEDIVVLHDRHEYSFDVLQELRQSTGQSQAAKRGNLLQIIILRAPWPSKSPERQDGHA